MTEPEPGKRLGILTKSEIQELYGLPRFSCDEKVKYFSIDPSEKIVLNNLRTNQAKLYFIVQMGYFKAKKMFFSFEPGEVEDDIRYIAQRHLPHEEDYDDLKIPRSTRMALQEHILQLCNYRHCTQHVRESLQERAYYLATICAKPIYIFRELLNYLEEQRIIVPGYSIMQAIVSRAISGERERLVTAATKSVPEEIREALESLLSAEDSLYEITLLKREPRDFSFKEITNEVRKGESLKEIYTVAQSVLTSLWISNENIKYYASLVGYYTVFRLKRMQREAVYVYLICFILNRYQKINDNLVNTFVYYIRKYMDEAKKMSRELVYEYKMEGNRYVKSVGKVLGLFVDEDIPDDTQFGTVKEMAFTLMERDKFPLMARYISRSGFNDAEYEWNHYITLARKFKRNVRYIFLHIDFQSRNPNDPLMTAVSFLKGALRHNKSLTRFSSSEFPCEFIPPRLKRYLYETVTTDSSEKTLKIKRLNVEKYEFLVYRIVKERLEAGEVFVSESLDFRHFEDDLIDNEQWKNKDRLLQSTNASRIAAPVKELLATLARELEDRLFEMNTKIQQGKNSYIKIAGKGTRITWSLSCPKGDDEINNPIYSRLPQVSIVDVLDFVNEQTDFMASFTHILERYVKNEADYQSLAASLVAYGTNIGLGKMAEISDMSFNELFTAAGNFIRLENLKTANDKISNAMGNLPIFKYYNLGEETIHSSSDGQKYETHFATINSRYSPKYFGLNKGITSYTLVANHVPINAKIIGANEHESHYVFDILFNNTSEIKSEIHSTDTHGANQVNFIILYLFGYVFAPRYKSLSNKSKKIYCFEHPHKYNDLIVRPSRKVNTRLIEEEWENIQKIMVSLAVKSTTQSTIVRKLSSYTKKNRTKMALWELDNIISSLYTLNYIDSPELRRNIQKAINRGESYHRLKRAIFHDNFGKFRVKTELEQHIWSECTRLLANSIIFYNGCILSSLLEQREKVKCHEDAELIKRISPIAWRHVNLYGRFEFSRKSASIDINNIIDALGYESIWHQHPGGDKYFD